MVDPHAVPPLASPQPFDVREEGDRVVPDQMQGKLAEGAKVLKFEWGEGVRFSWRRMVSVQHRS